MCLIYEQSYSNDTFQIATRVLIGANESDGYQIIIIIFYSITS